MPRNLILGTVFVMGSWSARSHMGVRVEWIGVAECSYEPTAANVRGGKLQTDGQNRSESGKK